MTGVTFDDFNSEDVYNLRTLKPFWFMVREAKGPDDILTWLNDDWINKKEDAQARLRVYAENIALYKGIHYRPQYTRSEQFRNNESITTSTRNPKLVVNHLYDMIETKLSKLTKFKSNVSVLPASNDKNDKINAKTIKSCIDTRWYGYDTQFDELKRDWIRIALIYGDAYWRVGWDKHMGEVQRDVRRAIRSKERVVPVAAAPRIGDVEYCIRTPDKIFPERQLNWENVDNITEVEYVPFEQLKEEYPDVADKIRTDLGRQDDLYTLEFLPFRNETLVKTFWHRPTKFLPEGRYIKYTQDTILEDLPYPFEDSFGHKVLDLPYVKLADINVPEELYGRSSIRNTKQLQLLHDNVLSMAVKSHALAGIPKWMVSNQANVKANSLSNDSMVVRFNGSVAPVLASHNAVPVNSGELLDRSENYIEKMNGIYSVSRGQPPVGVKAAVAMQFLDEQETERASAMISKINNGIIAIAKKTAERMGQYYKSDDGRLIKILGKDSQYEIKAFQEGIFDTPYDIRMQNSSALPESKTLRLQTIFDLKTAFPTMLTDAQILELLDLSNEQGFYDLTTVAVKSAESENDDFVSGLIPMEPMEWEDLITHWNAHVRLLQERSFKDSAPEVQTNLIAHITTTEFLMVERAKKNQLFLQKLMTLDSFPIFFVVNMNDLVAVSTGQMNPSTPQMPMMMPPAQAPARGKGNPAEKLNEQIPKEEMV